MTSPPEDSATTINTAPSEARQRPGGDAKPTDETHSPGEIGAGILGPDPLTPISDDERKRKSEGLLKLTAEYQAEHGAFTEEERARVRSRFTSLR